jgi:hypothetical protein
MMLSLFLFGNPMMKRNFFPTSINHYFVTMSRARIAMAHGLLANVIKFPIRPFYFINFFSPYPPTFYNPPYRKQKKNPQRFVCITSIYFEGNCVDISPTYYFVDSKYVAE